MKFYGNAQDPLKFSGKLLLKRQHPSPDSGVQARKNTPRTTTRRRPRTPVTRLKKNGAPVGRRSRPERPLLNWKIHDREKDEVHQLGVGQCDDHKSVQECGRRASKKGKKREVVISARKLAAVLWRMQLPQLGVDAEGWQSSLQRNEDRLGLQHGVEHVNIPFHFRLSSQNYGPDLKNLSQTPHSLCGTMNGLFCKNNMMEGATKWGPISLNRSDEVNQIYSQTELADQKISVVSVISALEVELEQARMCIQELENEHKSSKKKLEHFLKKVNEERASWHSREHEKIRSYIDDMKAELNMERKTRLRIEIVNSKLVNELADARLSSKCYLQDYEKEMEARELLEEVCDELAKEIGEDKADIEALKRESMKFKEEVEEERRMLQMAEVWREERVQMKLVDAKVALEEKYALMNKIVKDLENFLKSISASASIKEKREAELLRQTAASVNIHDMLGFKYEPPNTDDIFSIFEDPSSFEPNEKEIEPCISCTPESHASKIHTLSAETHCIGKEIIQRHSISFVDENGDMENESGWETVSHLEEQGSSYSPDGSAPSVNKNCLEGNASRTGSVLDWEEIAGQETPITEISEVCSVPRKQSKKVSSSIARLWKSGPNDGDNYKTISVDALMNGRLSNGRLPNGAILSPDRGSGKGGYSPTDFIGRWSSPDESQNPHSARGMKGCIPRSTHKNYSLKSKLPEARIESQKVQLRHVLKQNI